MRSEEREKKSLDPAPREKKERGGERVTLEHQGRSGVASVRAKKGESASVRHQGKKGGKREEDLAVSLSNGTNIRRKDGKKRRGPKKSSGREGQGGEGGGGDILSSTTTKRNGLRHDWTRRHCLRKKGERKDSFWLL